MLRSLIMSLSISVIFIMTGCSDGTVLPNTSSSGSGVKGPFVQGSTVKAYKLDANGSRSGTVAPLTTKTTDNLGTYSFSNFTWSGATEFEISGNYFNENTGTTTQTGTLVAVVNVVEGEALTANINVLTNLAAKRTKALMLAGTSLEAARTAAQDSVVELFGLTLASGVELDDLDLTQGSGTNSAANAELLRISAAIAATPSILADLETAIEDGNVSNDSTGSVAFATLAQAVNNVDLATVSSNLETQLGVADAPDEADTTTIATFATNAHVPVISVIGAKNYTVGTGAQQVNLTATDEDGDTIRFISVTSSNSSTVAATLSGSTLTLTPNVVGTSTITVTVTDGMLVDTESFLVTVTAVVNNAPVLSNISDASKTYGDVAFDITLNATDADADTITYSATSSDINVATVITNGNTITVTPIAAGTVTITATASDGIASVEKTMTLVVAPKPVTVTANSGLTKVYGNPNPVLTYTVTPALVSGDALSGTLGRVAGEDAGTYAITLGTLGNSNYDITFVPSNLTITKAVLTATVNTSAKIEGTPNPVFTANFSGFKFSDTASVLSNLVFATTAVTSSPVGTYGVTLSSFTATNYTLGAVTGANLTVTAAVAAKLSDPYIIGSILYQDDNGNGVWDSGEPESTQTTATGDFTFNVPLTAGKEIRIKIQGKHEGVTYDVALAAEVDTNGDVKAVTPLSTFTAKGMTTDDLAAMLNYAATNSPDGLGGVTQLIVDGTPWQIGATNLNLDPLSVGGDLLNVDLTTLTSDPTKLVELQASLTAYAILKIFEGSTTLKSMDAGTLNAEGNSLSGSVYFLTTNMLQGVTNSLSLNLLQIIETNLNALRTELINGSGGALDSTSVLAVAPTPKIDMIAKIAVTAMEKIATDGFNACVAETSGDVNLEVMAALQAAGTTAEALSLNNQEKIMEIGLKLYGMKYASNLSPYLSGIQSVANSGSIEAAHLLTGMSAAANGAITFRFDALNNVVALDGNGQIVTIP